MPNGPTPGSSPKPHRTARTSARSDADRTSRRALVEIGWVLAGTLDPADIRAFQEARSRLLEILRDLFPDFTWRMPVVRRRERQTDPTTAPVQLLDLGNLEREAYRWDFAVVVTGSDLVTYFKPFALGAPAKAINVAVLSTARIDPATAGEADPDRRARQMADRLVALFLHLFGHLNDLPHCEQPEDFMFDLQSSADLDRMSRFDGAEQEWMRRQLTEEADVRLEETGRYRGRRLRFYAGTIWRGATDITRTVLRIRPWLFPLRLSRLTTAAMSTLLILIITAESWELGMSQDPVFVAGFSLVILLGASLYLLERQRLLIRRRPQRLSEQRVISNLSVTIAVVLGMLTTYLVLFTLTFTLSQTLYPRDLVARWTGIEALEPGHFLVFAGLVAALGLAIGALGASFETQGYFRHVTYVDEET